MPIGARSTHVLSLIALVTCGSGNTALVPAPTGAVPSEVTPALRAALADTTATGGRVYRSDELRSAVLAAPRNPMPRFGREEGQARLRFVVDTAGGVESGTVEMVPGSEPVLATRVAEVLPRWHFLPAQHVRGQKVRALVELTIAKRGNQTTLSLGNAAP
jgi:outer membrane biosynthesis protein TonB